MEQVSALSTLCWSLPTRRWQVRWWSLGSSLHCFSRYAHRDSARLILCRLCARQRGAHHTRPRAHTHHLLTNDESSD